MKNKYFEQKNFVKNYIYAITIFIITYHSFPLRFKAHIGIKMCNELCFYFLSFICYHVLEVRSTLQSTVR